MKEGWWEFRGCPPPPEQAGLLDGGCLALFPQAEAGGKAGHTRSLHSTCPSCKSCPRSQPAASQSKVHRGILLLEVLWGLQLSWFFLTSSSSP